MNKNILLKSREITNKIESIILFAPNSLSNKLNSQIDKVKMKNLFSLERDYSKTIHSLERMSKLNDVGYYFNDGEVKFDKEDMRVKIYFDTIPNEETRKELKSHAFKWSPTNQAWQRKLTPDAIYTTKRMFKDIGSLEIIKVEDHTIKM